MSKLFDTTSFRVAEQALSVLNKRAAVIQHNIANADTPDYKCKYLYFEGILRDKISARAEEKYQKELSIGTALYVDENTSGQPDGNNVDNDTQQALFAKNKLQYDAMFNQLNAEFTMLRTAMRRN